MSPTKEILPDPQAREQLLDEAILAYLDAKQSGPVDKSALQSRFAPVAAELADFFAAEEAVGAALTPRSTLKFAAETPVGLATAGATPEGKMVPFGKYTDFAVIARGGMGTVYRCRDKELGRLLAMKVMHLELAQRPEYVRDFLEEAQIASQLTHPNIAPVHERGTLHDGRPYFTMKLVEGRTLSVLIREYHANRTAARFDALLRHFVAVCNALAYAHPRQVLHRDLKPDNVMVGAFDEVQVMDWGLSKVVLPSQESLIPLSPNPVEAVQIDGPESPTEPGLVRGTFAYMPPEQAARGSGTLDARCDVFALGALLCESLTGAPPYTSVQTKKQLRQRELWEAARTCATGPAFARLDTSGQPAELVALTKQCLAKEPDDRPKNATAVAEAVTGFLANVQEKLRVKEVERARAEAKAAEERKKRRWQVGLAAAVALFVTGCVAGGLWYTLDRQRREGVELGLANARQAEVESSIQQTDQHIKNEHWEESLSALQRAEGRAQEGVPADLIRTLAQQRRDIETVASLENIHSRSGYFNSSGLIMRQTDRLYHRTFQSYGIDLEATSVEKAAELIKQSRIREQLVVALDNWGWVAVVAPAENEWIKNSRFVPFKGGNRTAAELFFRLTQLSDSNSWRVRLRIAASNSDYGTLRTMLSSEEALRQPPRTLSVAAGLLQQLARFHPERGYDKLCIQMLQTGLIRNPGDFFLNLQMGTAICEFRPGELTLADGVAYLRAAGALRPNCAVVSAVIAEVYLEEKKNEQALRELDRAIDLNPEMAYLYTLKGRAFANLGKNKEAVQLCDKALSLDSSDEKAHFAAGMAYIKMGRFNQAIKYFQNVVQLNSLDVNAYYHLGYCQFQEKDFSGSVTAFQRYVDKSPKGADGHVLLAMSLLADGRLVEAKKGIQEARKRLGLFDPKRTALNRADAIVTVLLKLDGDPFANVAFELKEFSDGKSLLQFAQTCRTDMRYFATAARIYAEAFHADPELADDLDEWTIGPVLHSQRYYAITSALQAAGGVGKDAARLSEASKARLRELALIWFRVELRGEERQANRPPSRDGKGDALSSGSIQRRILEHWQKDPMSAAVRDPAALARLQETERQQWQQFWSEVDALLKKLDARPPKK